MTMFFRGERVDRDDFVVGQACFTDTTSGAIFISSSKSANVKHTGGESVGDIVKMEAQNEGDAVFFRVNAAYASTGIRDATGKMIFEGDTIEWGGALYAISWAESLARFIAVPVAGDKPKRAEPTKWREAKVVSLSR